MAGEVVLSVGGKEVRLRAPHAYQLDGTRRRAVPVHYRLRDGDLSFVLGTYDRSEPLTIDPVLSYSTYLGGNGGDAAYGIALDASGDAYLTGTTASANFPVTSTTLQAANSGGGDVFITKFNPDGDRDLTFRLSRRQQQ